MKIKRSLVVFAEVTRLSPPGWLSPALLALLAAVPTLAAFQGLDLTDTGWVATNYQLIFDDPESLRYWFHMWLSNVIGGLFHRAAPFLGLLGLKLGSAVVFWTSCFVVTRALRPEVPAGVVLPGLLLAYGLQFPRVSVVYYNNLSALFHFAAVLCLLDGLRRDRLWPLAAAGVIEAANVFVRLPNAAGLALVLVIGYGALLQRPGGGRLGARLAAFAGGYAAGLLAVLTVMAAVGHLGLYVDSVSGLFRSTGSGDSAYGLRKIVGRFVIHNGRAVVYGAAAAACVAAIGWALRRRPAAAAAVLIVVGALTFVVASRLVDVQALMRIALGFSYVPLAVAVLLGRHLNRDLRVACFASLVVLAVLSLGSDTGTVVSVYGYILAFPLVLAVGNAAVRGGGPPDAGASRQAALGSAFFVAYCAAASVSFLLTGTYRDSSDRLQMTATVADSSLRGVYTTPARARVLDEVLAELRAYVRPGDPLLALESTPMINFATRTRPYLGNSWPDLYVGDELERSLDWALGARPGLPVAVQAIRDTRDGSWPANTSLSNRGPSVTNRGRIQQFLDRYGYKVVWENAMFRILEPALRSTAE